MFFILFCTHTKSWMRNVVVKFFFLLSLTLYIYVVYTFYALNILKCLWFPFKIDFEYFSHAFMSLLNMQQHKDCLEPVIHKWKLLYPYIILAKSPTNTACGLQLKIINTIDVYLNSLIISYTAHKCFENVVKKKSRMQKRMYDNMWKK